MRSRPRVYAAYRSVSLSRFRCHSTQRHGSVPIFPWQARRRQAPPLQRLPAASRALGGRGLLSVGGERGLGRSRMPGGHGGGWWSGSGAAAGQYLTDIRRPGGLGKDPVRAERRAAALAAIDPDWNPRERGTVDWQRHYAYFTQLLVGGARLDDVVPGVTLHGKGIGRWLATQRRDFSKLNTEQQRRLSELGVKKASSRHTHRRSMSARAGAGAEGADGVGPREISPVAGGGAADPIRVVDAVVVVEPAVGAVVDGPGVRAGSHP